MADQVACRRCGHYATVCSDTMDHYRDEIAALTADLAARGETIVRLEGERDSFAKELSLYEVENVRLHACMEKAGLAAFQPRDTSPEDIAEHLCGVAQSYIEEIARLEAQVIEERWQKDRAEFQLAHHTFADEDGFSCCRACGNVGRDGRYPDPRHAFSDDDWRRDAREQWEKERGEKEMKDGIS